MSEPNSEQLANMDRARALLESSDWAQLRFDHNNTDLCVMGAITAMFNPLPKRKGWRITRARLVGDHATFSLTLYLPKGKPDKQVSITLGKREVSLTKGWGYLAGE